MRSERFVVWLEWQGFYADDTLVVPQVVVRDRQVLDVNAVGRRCGIQVGMSVSEARNIAPQVVRKPWREEETVERQRAWLDLCLPFSGLVEPIDGHIAALDLSGHPRPREVAERLTATLVEQVRLPLRYGAGPSKWVAALASRSHDLRRAIADPKGFLAPMSIEELLPIQTASRDRLAFLGYRKIGDVSRLAVETLRGQFGEEGLLIAQAARGATVDPVRALYPPDTVAAMVSFDGPPETVETLEHGYSRIARELGERLASRNAIAKRVEFVLQHEEGEPTALSRTFTRSLATPRDLINALRLMLPVPPERPIELIRVSLPELRKARRVQLDVEDRRSRADLEESVRTAIMHVQTTFGEEAVLRGSEVHIPRWLKVRRAYRDVNGWAWV